MGLLTAYTPRLPWYTRMWGAIRAPWRAISAPTRGPGDMPPTRQTIAPIEPIYWAPSDWTMDEVDRALKLHCLGDFSLSGRLADALWRDEYIASLVALRLWTRSGLPVVWTQDIPGYDQEYSQVWPLEEQEQAHFQTLMMGFALAYDARESYMDAPRWKVWPAWATRYDQQRATWQILDRERGYVDVTPGDGRWALFRLRSSRPWLAGMILPTAPIMIIRQAQIFNCANHSHVYATPSRILTAPERMAETEDIDKILKALRYWVGDSALLLPNGCKLNLLELKEVTYEIYLKLREALDGSLSILWSGNMGMVKAAGGWGAEHTSRRVSQQLTERDVLILGTTEHREITASYDRWKRGTADITRVPKRNLDVTPPGDKDADAKRKESESRAGLVQAQELATLGKVQLPEGQVIDLADRARKMGYRVVPGQAQAPAVPQLKEAA